MLPNTVEVDERMGWFEVLFQSKETVGNSILYYSDCIQHPFVMRSFIWMFWIIPFVFSLFVCSTLHTIRFSKRFVVLAVSHFCMMKVFMQRMSRFMIHYEQLKEFTDILWIGKKLFLRNCLFLFENQRQFRWAKGNFVRENLLHGVLLWLFKNNIVAL